MPHRRGHAANEPFTGVLPSDKNPATTPTSNSLMNQLTNMFRTALAETIQANKDLFTQYQAVDQALEERTPETLRRVLPFGNTTFGVPYPPSSSQSPFVTGTGNASATLSPAIQNLFQKIMQGLTMQSGVPGTIRTTPGQPSMPLPTPTSGVPGTAAYQKDQRLQDPRLDASMMAGMRPGDTFSNSPLPPQLMNPNLGSVPFGQNTAMSPQEFANFVSKTQGLKDQSRQTYTPGM